jgi:hypothetical protein
MPAGAQAHSARYDAADDPLVHILWMNGGLGCDGDSVALTAAHAAKHRACRGGIDPE